MIDLIWDYSVLQLLWTFLVWIFSSFIGAIAWWWGLISIPFLIFLGLPPQIAIATNKVWAVWLYTWSLIRFIRSEAILRSYVLPFLILSLVGGYIGASILIEIDARHLNTIIWLIILSMLPLVLLSKSLGIEYKQTSIVKTYLWYLAYFLVMIYGWFFGWGWWLLIFYVLLFFFWFTFLQANATDLIPFLAMTVITSLMFLHGGLVDITLAVILFGGMLVWWYLGANTAIKKWNQRVRWVFIFIILASATKLLLF